MKKVDPIHAFLKSLRAKERDELRQESRDRQGPRQGEWERDEMMDSFFISTPSQKPFQSRLDKQRENSMEESTQAKWVNEFTKAESKLNTINKENQSDTPVSQANRRVDAIRRHLVPDLGTILEHVIDKLDDGSLNSEWKIQSEDFFDVKNQWKGASVIFREYIWADEEDDFKDDIVPFYEDTSIYIVINDDGNFGWHIGDTYDADEVKWFDTKNFDGIVEKLTILINR
jgi:hypothetical protein